MAESERQIILRRMKTLSEMYDIAAGPHSQDMGPRASRQRPDYGGDEGFYGGDTFEQSLYKARFGWKEGLDLITPVGVRLEARIGSYVDKPGVYHDVVGGTPDVAATLMGVPEDMLNFEYTIEPAKKSKLIRIVVNVSASWNVHKDIIIRRGAVAASVVAALQSAGMMAELVVCEWVGNYGTPDLYGIEAPIHSPGEVMCLDKIVYAIANQGFLRRICFGIEEAEPADIRKKWGFVGHGGYGTPANPPDEYRGDLYFPAMLGGDPDYASENAAVATALRMLHDLGVVSDEAYTSGEYEGRR